MALDLLNRSYVTVHGFDRAQTLGLLSDLRRAVGQNELRLYLQPKLSLDSGSVLGAEALVRWHHPTRGMVPPAQFIPFAEQTGFIREVTLWVFEEAARLWQMLHADGLTLTLSVNLSTRDLLDPELPRKFDALTRDDMQRLLADVWRETRKTVIYVTHNVAEAVYLADRVVVMTPHPGTVKVELPIKLERPRDPLSVEFLDYQKQLLRHLGQEAHA